MNAYGKLMSRTTAVLWVMFTISTICVEGAGSKTEATTFKDLLSGTTIPLTLQLKDLSSEWRRINAANAGDPSGMSRIYAMYGLAGGSGSYYTKGETVTVEGETYLIAYRVQTKQVDVMAMMRGGMGNKPPEPEKPTPESTLVLSLLHLHTAGSISDIRPFNLEAELAGGDTSAAALDEARDKAAKAAGLQNLRDLGQALLAYAKDGDKTLPQMKDAESACKALEPYTKNKNACAPPDSKEQYQPNASLSGKKMGDIAKPEEIVAFYEAKAVNDTRGVLYLDGRVERVAESKWAGLKKASKIP